MILESSPGKNIFCPPDPCRIYINALLVFLGLYNDVVAYPCINASVYGFCLACPEQRRRVSTGFCSPALLILSYLDFMVFVNALDFFRCDLAVTTLAAY